MLDISTISRHLARQDIRIDEGTVKLHSEQGFVNEVYTVESNRGKLIIHIGKHSDEHIQRHKPRRIYGLSQFLKNHPKIPTSNVIAIGKDINGKHFSVQEFVEGKKLSQIKDKTKHLKQLAHILAYMHQINVQGGGHIEFRSHKIQGRHKDWLTFLKKESYLCLKVLYSEKKIPKADYFEYKQKLRHFFRKYKRIFEGVKGKLLHGDILLDNILIHNERIVAVIDLEWSVSGDPAWDFAGHPKYDDDFLKIYFKELRKLGAKFDEDNFRFRRHLYRMIILLFIAHTFRNSKYFRPNFDAFAKRLADAI